MIKLNLGSGNKKYSGFINIDDDPNTNPDYLINLDDINIHLPFEDSSVDEIKAHHILEHIGDGYIPLLKEIYRICKNGALIDVLVPHHQHDIFYDDPTHKRPITVSGMYLFSKKFNLQDIERKGSSSTLGLKYDIDFEVIDFSFDYDPFYVPMINNFHQLMSENKLSEQDQLMFQRLMREATNVALQTKIKMIAVK